MCDALCELPDSRRQCACRYSLGAPHRARRVVGVRIRSLDPSGPAVAGQRILGETGPRLLQLRLRFQVAEVDATRYRFMLDVQLPFGIAVREDIDCAALDVRRCRGNYRCDLNSQKGWRGILMRTLLTPRLDAGPEDSLSRLKRAAERRFAGGTDDGH